MSKTAGAGVSSIGTDRQTVTTPGTVVQLQSHSSVEVVVTAESDNTGLIAVGDSSVKAAVGSQQGTILFPGQTIPSPIKVPNTNRLYIDAAIATDGVSYIFLN